MQMHRSLWSRSPVRIRFVAISIAASVCALLLAIVAINHGDLNVGRAAAIILAITLVAAILSFLLGFTHIQEGHASRYQQATLYAGIVYSFLSLAMLMVMGVAAKFFDGFLGFLLGGAFLVLAILSFLFSKMATREHSGYNRPRS